MPALQVGANAHLFASAGATFDDTIRAFLPYSIYFRTVWRIIRLGFLRLGHCYREGICIRTIPILSR
jgi:hypothetical protein